MTQAGNLLLGLTAIVAALAGVLAFAVANDINGAALPNTNITANPGGQPLAQRSNFLLTGGFTLPGFDGVLRAFRTFKPVADATKPTGWKFVNDGAAAVGGNRLERRDVRRVGLDRDYDNRHPLRDSARGARHERRRRRASSGSRSPNPRNPGSGAAPNVRSCSCGLSIRSISSR